MSWRTQEWEPRGKWVEWEGTGTQRRGTQRRGLGAAVTKEATLPSCSIVPIPNDRTESPGTDGRIHGHD
jgi:hypothetical protein